MKTTHQISLPGGRTLVACGRPGEGTPVVFIHGLFGRGAAWSEVAAELTQPAVAFDLPGFGGSDLPLRADVAAYAADLAAGLDALGVDRFELVGHSFGGAVAASLAELLGDRVVSLTLLAPAGFGRIALAEVGRRVLRGAEQQAMVALTVCPATCSYRGPVTALWGERDRVVRPSHARRLLSVLPQARVAILDGADHHLVSGSRDAIVELVRSGRTPRRTRRERTRRARRVLRPSFPAFPRLRLGSEPRFA